MSISKINMGLTMDFLIKTPEGLYLDRKRAKISIQDLANEIADGTNSEVVQVIGNKITLFRKRKEKSKFEEF